MTRPPEFQRAMLESSPRAGVLDLPLPVEPKARRPVRYSSLSMAVAPFGRRVVEVAGEGGLGGLQLGLAGEVFREMVRTFVAVVFEVLHEIAEDFLGDGQIWADERDLHPRFLPGKAGRGLGRGAAFGGADGRDHILPGLERIGVKPGDGP